MIDDEMYKMPSIEGYTEEVKAVVVTFVESVIGDTIELQRVRLPQVKKLIQTCVDYVMNNLPNGVERIDGNVIEPILDEVINEKINALPVEEISEEL